MNINDEQIDVIREFINIGVGRASASLNELLSTHVTLRVPVVRGLTIKEMEEDSSAIDGADISMVKLDFKGKISGISMLVFPLESASRLVSLLSGDEDYHDADIDALKEGLLTEVGNILINAVMGSFANMFEFPLTYTIPVYSEGDIRSLIRRKCDDDGSVIIMAVTNFLIEEHMIEGKVLIVFEIDSLKELFGKAGIE